MEIEAGGVAGFREAAAGEFAAVYGHVHPDQEAQGVGAHQSRWRKG